MPRPRPSSLSLSCLTPLIMGAALAACHSAGSNTSAGGGTTGGGTTGGSGTVDGSAGPPATYTATLRILDTSGKPVTGAQLAVGATLRVSDSAGSVSVPSVPTQSLQAAVVSKAGFMTLPVQLTYSDAGQKVKTLVLHAPQIVATFASGQPVTVDLHVHAVAFAQSSFQDANNTPYAGTVHLAADALDPASQVFDSYAGFSTYSLRADFDPESLPPGALVLQDKAGHPQTVLPEAMVNIQATQDDGTALTLNAQTPATVTLALTPFTKHTVGEVLPLMSYDANSTRWTQEGSCTVQAQAAPKTGLECVGTVTHFSAVAVASTGSAEFNCGNFGVSLDGNAVGSGSKVWVEEVLAPGAVTRSSHTTPLDTQLLCYVGAIGSVRVALEASVNGSTRIFRTGTLALQPTVESAQEFNELQAGDPVHACFRCPVVSLQFSSADGVAAVDADGDGYYANGALADCNDQDSSVHPGAAESVCDAVDKNCDGTVPSGVATVAGAGSSAVWNSVWCKLACAQKSTEVPQNDVDEDCDGVVSDRDGDGYYNALDPAFQTAFAADANTQADCDDQNPGIHPGGRELAGNKIDEDCDGFMVDVDGDGYIARAQAQVDLSTVDGLSSTPPDDLYNDCDDWDATINPNQQDLSRESVFAQFYTADPNNGVIRSGALCSFIGADGALNAAGRRLLVDVNCDGYYSDLDGDGYTVQGDTHKGDDHTGDCDDVDPRRSTASGCPAAASAAFDGGVCVPKASPPVAPMLPGSFSVSGVAVDGVNLIATPVYNPNGPVSYTVWYQKNGFTGLDANTLATHALHGDPVDYTQYPYQGALNGDTHYAVTLVAEDSIGQRAVYPVKTFTTAHPGLGVGNYNDSFVDPNSVTPNSATFTFHSATGGTGNYSYTVYLQLGGFRDSSRGSIMNGTLIATLQSPGDVPLTGLYSNAHYQAAAIVDDGNTQVAYYVQDFTTKPEPPPPPGGNTAGGTTSFAPYLRPPEPGGGFEPSARN